MRHWQIDRPLRVDMLHFFINRGTRYLADNVKIFIADMTLVAELSSLL